MPISVLAQETNINNSQDNNNTNTNVEKNSKSEETSLISNAVSGLLMEESTGKIIFSCLILLSLISRLKEYFSSLLSFLFQSLLSR